MTDSTPRFALPLLAAGQAQKELFHNEALLALDLLVQATAETLGDPAPPAAPLPGQAWIVGAQPSGDWTGQANGVAGWDDGGWRFVAPIEGMRLWVRTVGLWATFRGGAWQLGREAVASVNVGGVQVVAAQQPAIPAPAGGTVVDQAARTALNAVLEALRTHGLVAR
jgi:hypothetical protein